MFTAQPTAGRSSWQPPPNDLQLVPDEVHVWRAGLDLPEFRVARLFQSLSEDERSRAEHFHFAKDRQHFIAARGFLRAILAHYLNIQPAQLTFRYNAYGKPLLAAPRSQTPLHFNVSHSGGMALYAVSWGRLVGIDLERVRVDVQYDQIVSHFFSPRERAALRGVPEPMRRAAFFFGWTCKEAYVKARGEGLLFPLTQFSVSLTPGEPARLLHLHDNPQEATHWQLHHLQVGPGYSAAMAVEGGDWAIRCWEWNDRLVEQAGLPVAALRGHHALHNGSSPRLP